jgi:hypothetical protein
VTKEDTVYAAEGGDAIGEVEPEAEAEAEAEPGVELGP